MGVGQSGTSLARHVHFRAVASIHQYAECREDTRFTDEPDVHTLGLCFDPSNVELECVTEASHPHTQDLYGMERKQQRHVCEPSGG